MPGDLGPQYVVTGARVLLPGQCITEEQGLTGREGDVVRATVANSGRKAYPEAVLGGALD